MDVRGITFFILAEVHRHHEVHGALPLLDSVFALHRAAHGKDELRDVFRRFLELAAGEALRDGEVGKLHERPEARQLRDVLLHGGLLDGRGDVLLHDAQERFELACFLRRERRIAAIGKRLERLRVRRRNLSTREERPRELLHRLHGFLRVLEGLRHEEFLRLARRHRHGRRRILHRRLRALARGLCGLLLRISTSEVRTCLLCL